MAGIYFHIPFCKRICAYCDFYKSADRKRLPEVAEAMHRELDARRDYLRGEPLHTRYFGGGTPSLCPPELIGGLLEHTARLFDCSQVEETTLEANPDDLTPEYLAALRHVGIDRLSIGVQSFDDDCLRLLNRRHTAGRAIEALRDARRAGFDNLTIDLIFGIPGFGGDSLRRTLDTALETGVEHISAYQLSVEPDSALDRLVSGGRYREAPEDLCSRQYSILCSRLAEAGYHHYEVSNFALPGHEAVHNSAYWNGSPYLGLGPGAHSYSTDGRRHIRSWNIPSVGKYVSAFPEDSSRLPDGIRGSEILTVEQMNMERIMLALRTDTGIAEEELRRTGDTAGTDRMIAAGNLVRTEGGRIRIPEEKFFISDSIIRELV